MAEAITNEQDRESTTSEQSCDSGTINQRDGSRQKTILEREVAQVRQARIAVAAAIIVCAMAVGVSVYGEINSFKLEYELHVQEVIKLVQWEVQYNFALMQQLSASVTAAAVMTGAVFPNLTQPYFEISGGYVDGLGGIMSTMFAPLIKVDERDQWEEYASQNLWWLEKGEKLREVHPGHRDPMHGTHQDHEHDRRLKKSSIPTDNGVSKRIFHWENDTKVAVGKDRKRQLYAPLWQVSPPSSTSINADLLSEKIFNDMFDVMVATNYSVLSPATEIGDLFDFLFDEEEKHLKTNPHSFIMEPVYSAFTESPELVGVLIAVTKVENLLDKLLPDDAVGMTCVVSDSCGNTMTYTIEGREATFVGYGDLHDTSFDKLMRSTEVELYKTTVPGMCSHELFIYPSTSFLGSYKKNKPSIYTCIVAVAFFVTAVLLVVYDRATVRQNEKTMRSALRTGALVNSLFPASVRDRVMDSANACEDMNGKWRKDNEIEEGRFKSRPIADFFASTTLMFADIAGFTAWSSTREPFQVFELLETIYGAFDALAKKRDVFKVETVGDCYVAACGIPKPNVQHAVIMSRFARDCILKMNELMRQLDVQMGPDTSALLIRIGLHSGPVTGGVLRGENARFQLFGDTVNTTARMESTGLPNQIQISQATVDLLIEAGKSNWFVPRDEIVHAKGKGAMRTFWLAITDRPDTTSSHMLSGSDSSREYQVEDKQDELRNAPPSCNRDKTSRLVDWHVEVLMRLLKRTMQQRQVDDAPGNVDWQSSKWAVSHNVRGEVAEIIELPDVVDVKTPDTGDAIVTAPIESQLRDYVVRIANLYPDHPFHNFEHASHVTMSVCKLMGRIVAPPTLSSTSTSTSSTVTLKNQQHDHTYGITSDPLTQFACLFSALIHDVNHPGVPNTQLVKERAAVALTYGNQSVAEQNSVDIAFQLLLEPQFEQLRHALCATKAELKRFRQLVINSVMATDIMAPDLKAVRDGRWNKAFNDAVAGESPDKVKNRKATIVIDHLIQASDVAHTMQHWHVYRKWNERLFVEMSRAYEQGRAERDPADFWQEGELGFFDHYVIPLAKKLQQCGVFGAASDEYLTYATKNRDEWEMKGQAIVAEMVQRRRQHQQQQHQQQGNRCHIDETPKIVHDPRFFL